MSATTALALLRRLAKVEARVDGLLEAAGLQVPVQAHTDAPPAPARDPETTTAPMAVH